MFIELYAELDTCIDLCARLAERMEADTQEAALSLRGEIYDECKLSSDLAREKVLALKKQLLILQAEWELRM